MYISRNISTLGIFIALVLKVKGGIFNKMLSIVVNIYFYYTDFLFFSILISKYYFNYEINKPRITIYICNAS